MSRSAEFSKSPSAFTDKVVTKVVVDPNEVFADVNRDNNTWAAAGAGVS